VLLPFELNNQQSWYFSISIMFFSRYHCICYFLSGATICWCCHYWQQQMRSLDNRQFDTQNFQFINISISTSIRPLAMCTFANCRQIPDTRYKYLDTNQSKIVSVSLHLDNVSCSCCSLLFNHSY